jgi:hypothetical protein
MLRNPAKRKENESSSTKLKNSIFVIDGKLASIELNTRIKNLFKSCFLFLQFLGNQTEGSGKKIETISQSSIGNLKPRSDQRTQTFISIWTPRKEGIETEIIISLSNFRKISFALNRCKNDFVDGQNLLDIDK